MTDPRPLTFAEFTRAKSDPGFRRWLVEVKGYAEASLPPLAAAQAKPSTAESLIDEVAQGATFGLARKAGAFGTAAGESLRETLGLSPDQGVPFLERAKQIDEERRQQQAGFRSEHPILATGANIAGGALNVAGAGKAFGGLAAPAAQGMLRRMGIGALEGAGIGAVQGAGEAPMGQEAGGAALGGVLGGVVGGLTPPVVSGVGKAGGWAYDKGRGMFRRAAQAAPELADETGALFPGRLGRKGAAPMMPETPPSPLDQLSGEQKRALDLILTRGGRQGQRAQALLDAIEAKAARGQPFTLQETGDPMYQLADLIAQSPYKGAETVKAAARARLDDTMGSGTTAAGRAGRALAEDSGLEPKFANAALDEITARRSAEAAPLYEKAMQQGPVGDAKVITSLLRITDRNPDVLQEATSVAYRNGLGDADLFVNGKPTMRLLHFVKQVQDGKVAQAVRAHGAGRPLAGFDLKGEQAALSEFRAALREASPAYAKAMDTFAGESALLDAWEAGTAAASKRSQAIRYDLSQLGSESERNAYKQALVSKWVEQLGGTAEGGNVYTTLLGRMDKDKVRAVFPDEAAWRRFAAFMEGENQIAKNVRGLANSKTASRLLNADDIGADLASSNRNALTFGPRAAVARFVGAKVADAQRAIAGLSPGVADATAQYLTAQPGTPEWDALRQLLLSRESDVLGRQAVSRGITRVSAGQAGGLGGRAF